MGGLRQRLPITFATMGVGALAIAGVPPFAGFFSKDEILFRAFESNKVIWVLALVTAFMTAFYMARLIAMTFYGSYRGTPRSAGAAHDATTSPGAHGHTLHGLHESPRLMTAPLVILAIGAALAGFVGIPAALGGGNAIERFLQPSFSVTSAGATPGNDTSASSRGAATAGEPGQSQSSAEPTGAAPGLEFGLMLVSVLVAAGGIGFAWRVYVVDPQASERLAHRFAGAHRLLENKYYVDEIYDATVVAGTMAGGRRLWGFDRVVVDGIVNGSSWVTLFGSWMSGLTDRRLVDGIVNSVGTRLQGASYRIRQVQTGLVQNYALVMLFGVFAFVSLYLFVR